MKRILIFLATSTVIAVIVAGVWISAVGDTYLVAVAKAMNGMLYVTGFPSVDVSVESKDLVFWETDVLFRRRRVGSMHGVSLVMNLVPLVAIMLATPRVTWKERFGNLMLAVAVLFVTHLAHTYANFYVATHRKLQVTSSSWLGYGQVFAYYAFNYFRTFWEGMGRMLTPFVIWGMLYPHMIFGPEALLSSGKRT